MTQMAADPRGTGRWKAHGFLAADVRKRIENGLWTRADATSEVFWHLRNLRHLWTSCRHITLR
jgi:hypothetical protein